MHVRDERSERHTGAAGRRLVVHLREVDARLLRPRSPERWVGPVDEALVRDDVLPIERTKRNPDRGRALPPLVTDGALRVREPRQALGQLGVDPTVWFVFDE